MKIAVFGTGSVGATIGSKLIQLGHEVKMGSRKAGGEKALKWVGEAGANASEGTYAEAAQFGEFIFNCTAGVGSLEALSLAGEANLSEKILVDISNPLDFSKGMPPSLSVCNTDSLGEQIQAAHPSLKVVKTLNTLWAGLMVNPGLINGGDHSIFMAGNDPDAKSFVSKNVLQAFGWKESNILDLGDITKARGLEMYLPLWLSVYGATKNGAFNIKIVS
jgi:predicted dinucleotide-binding enzyme